MEDGLTYFVNKHYLGMSENDFIDLVDYMLENYDIKSCKRIFKWTIDHIRLTKLERDTLETLIIHL